jgi:hypothetical protein
VPANRRAVGPDVKAADAQSFAFRSGPLGLLSPDLLNKQVALQVPGGATADGELIIDSLFTSRLALGAKVCARADEHFLMFLFPELRVDLGEDQATSAEDALAQAAQVDGPFQGLPGESCDQDCTGVGASFVKRRGVAQQKAALLQCVDRPFEEVLRGDHRTSSASRLEPESTRSGPSPRCEYGSALVRRPFCVPAHAGNEIG